MTNQPNWSRNLLTPTNSQVPSWQLFQSVDRHGRGLRATRDIAPNELIFSELPLLIAPATSSSQWAEVCIGCFRLASGSQCQCGLTVCVQCSGDHRDECRLLRSWSASLSSREMLVILPAARALRLDGAARELWQAMQANRKSDNRPCPLDGIGQHLSETDREHMQRTIAILDTNAFETVIVDRKDPQDREVTLKGLFALGGQLNHECSPNTRHSARRDDASGQVVMSVEASRPIAKGEELTTTYTSLVWSRPARLAHLWLTKQFWCRCRRCEAAEDGDLAALRCRSCPEGLVRPQPNRETSELDTADWICSHCEGRVKYTHVCQTQQIVGGILGRIEVVDLGEAPQRHPIVQRLLGAGNALLVEAKLRVIWSDTTTPLRKDFCEEILGLLQRIGAGQCTLRGLLLYQLWKSSSAWQRDDRLLAEAMEILRINSIAPRELWNEPN